MYGYDLGLNTAMLLNGSGEYAPESAALFARMTTQPDSTRKALYNALIVSLINGGLWEKLDALYLMAAHDSQVAGLNIIQDAYNLTAVNSPTFTADRGFAGNGSTSYLKNGFIPSSAGGRFVQDSASLGVWINTDAGIDTSCSIGVSNYAMVRPNFTGGKVNYRLNTTASTTTTSGTVASAIGSTIVTRRDSLVTEAFHDGVSLGTTSVASSILPTVEFFILANNNAGSINSPTTRRHAAAFIGSSLSASEALGLHNALNTFLTAIGGA